MEICPRCKRDIPELICITTIDCKTRICGVCSIQEKLCDDGVQDDVVEMHMQNRFEEELLK